MPPAWTWEVLDIPNCREIIDNVVDTAHFFYVHYAFPRYFKNVFEGHVATQYMSSRGRDDKAGGYSGGLTLCRRHSRRSRRSRSQC